jgi:AraC-like DNA-binding protein
MKTNNIANRTNSTTDPVSAVTGTPRPVVAMAKDFPDGHCIPMHQHAKSQLLYAAAGVMTVTTEKGVWVVPPLRAVWIPAHTEHQIHISGRLAMRTLYIDPGTSSSLPDTCCVVSVSSLLRELIVHATTLPRLYAAQSPEERLFNVILDLIEHLDTTPLELPIPGDPRLVQIYKHLARNPADNRTLGDWGRTVGATARTLCRQFRNQTGMSFRQWRQQIRILEALKRLGLGESVTSVAIGLGYDSPSAFISMFRKALGKTPGQYFKAPM